MQIKLAEALLRRKELQEKVNQIRQIKDKDLFEVKMRRQSVAEGLDEVVAQVPKVTLGQVTTEYDFYASQLRKIDGIIQQANWTCEVEVTTEIMDRYSK